MSVRPFPSAPRGPRTTNCRLPSALEGIKILSKSANLPADSFDPASSASPAWKQEVNQRLAAHRHRRGGQQEPVEDRAHTPRPASDKAAQIQARVAARYAQAPSYSEALAGEARAVVRAAGAAAEAARTAQAAAEAVLANLESGFESGLIRREAPPLRPQAPTPQLAQHYAPPAAPPRWQDEPPAAQALPEPQVHPRWEETLPPLAPPPVTVETTEHDVWAEMRLHPAPWQPLTRPSVSDRHRDEGELFPFDELDLRASHDPIHSATIEPAQPIAANLIEFPRELVAPRKARPRLAEGPYRRTAQNDSSPQLSIFEVDPDLLDPPVPFASPSLQPIAPPEWASIELDHHPEPNYTQAYTQAYGQPAPIENPPSYTSQAYADTAFNQPAYAEEDYAEPEYATAAQVDYVASSSVAVGPATFAPIEYSSPTPYAPQPAALSQPLTASHVQPQAQTQTCAVELLVATIGDRALACVVDLSIVTLAGVAAAFVAMASTDHLPGVRTALIASAAGLFIFWLLYQYLFLSFAEEGTPGMRYARIALCTFNDDNPTRQQMRMRIPAMLLAALPLGLGLAWSLFDREHVSWHDRWTQTYQRKY